MRAFVYLSVITITAFAGLWNLRDLPASWYGDISIVHEYVLAIREEQWPWHISESAGPVYHYLISPGTMVLGHSYHAYKILSVIVGQAGVVGTVLFVSAIFGFPWGVIAGLLIGTSFWFLAWERTGNSQILIPVFVSYVLWVLFTLSAEKSGFARSRVLPVLAGLVVALSGMFLYPQVWHLPVVYAAGLMVLRKRIPWRRVAVPISGLIFFAAVLFLIMLSRSSQVLSGGYLGSKIWPMFAADPASTIQTLFSYAIRAGGALHVRGDGTFRVNVPGSPQLDIISGVLFFFGVFWLFRSRMKVFLMCVAGMLFLALPSVLPTLPKEEVPNSGRMIGILPIVIVFVVSGLRLTYQIAGKYVAGVLVLCVLGLNLYKYFIQYPNVLPNKNNPWGRVVSEYIDTLPKTTQVMMIDCCWGDWGQPEPKAVLYQLHDGSFRTGLMAVSYLSCADIDRSTDVVLIGRPIQNQWNSMLSSCIAENLWEVYRDASGQKVFGAVYIPKISE